MHHLYETVKEVLDIWDQYCLGDSEVGLRDLGIKLRAMRKAMPHFICGKCGGTWFTSTLDPVTHRVTKVHCRDEYNRGCRWSADR
jgi:hypothetical protein